jgi:hypothetical protein
VANVKLEDLSELVLANDTLLYGEKTPYTALADAGKIPLSLMDARYLQVAGDTMAGNLDMGDNLKLGKKTTFMWFKRRDRPSQMGKP